MRTGTFITFSFGYAFVLFYVYEEYISRYINGFWTNYAIQTALLVFGLIIIFAFKIYLDLKAGILTDEEEGLEE
ncbi:hypothetical protein NFX39_01285 [Fructobacillus sp. W13]|uniref:Uncharacterized protein n=1 Tax=Fructobacillus apis TaxID=2935017 RepID=A0ABT0ZP06_9LACO|nr:hypothetical protein [Fructobacillus apis]MCO0831727.1 hypothetical protein [Fructobacillus apis]